WLLGEREHWRQQAETILTQLIAQQSRLAHYHEALRHARRLLRLTPWNESIHRQVMLMLVWTGQRAAALKQFEQCQMILQQELGVAVAEETFTLYERIKQNATLALHNLPAAATPFIGRKEELSRLAGWLTHDHVRLITITGLGGIGKTRLAQAAARQLLARPESEFTYSARFPDGIFFIALAPLQSSAQIVAAIAQTLEFRFSGRDDTEQQLQIYLANKQLLLILDNFEHLLDGAAKVAALLRSAPRVSILVTSRERLNLYQAQVMTIEGLSYPDTTQPDLENYDAVQLFLQAIRRVRYDFSLTEATANALMRICQLMEGMPLGLELAASWIDSRSLSAIVTELEQGLNLLQTEAVDLPRRHRSIRAAFDITWLALSSAERDLFAQLSVFRGGFTLHAAKEIGRATQPVLASLVGKSLLRDSKADKRYDLHELLRQYGAEKLSRNATVETQIRAAHCRYYCDYLHQQEQAIFGADVAKAIKVIESDLDNVRLAWHEAVR
ncbi:MAG: AAA family ATPase, partial [Caldilineaceae bacterium]|nr:AAA family ATPase [Caldilineaceae bacterium]